MRRDALRADALLLLAAAIWGFAFVAQRAGMAHVGPFLFNGIRFALGSLALVPIILSRRRAGEETRPPLVRADGEAVTPRSGRRTYGAGLLAGCVLFAGASLQQVGIVTTTAGKAGFITGLYVVIVPLMGLSWGHRTGRGTWIGAFLAAAGLYLLSVTSPLRMERGDLLVLAGSFFWAAHVHLIGRLSPRHDPIELAAVQFAAVSLLSTGVALAVEPMTINGIRAAALPILYGGLMSVGVSFTLQVVAQRTAPPAHAAILLSLEAVFALAGGWIILGEVLSARGLAGCAMMLAGMLVSQLTAPGAPENPFP